MAFYDVNLPLRIPTLKYLLYAVRRSKVSIMRQTSYFSGATIWKVVNGGQQSELFVLTRGQIGDILQKEKEAKLFEYDEKSVKLVYGSEEAFKAANDALQLDLFKNDDSGAGDLFSYRGQGEITGEQGEGGNGNTRWRKPPLSSLLGEAGKAIHPAYTENRKGQRRVSFVGQTVSSVRDIAELFQAYRNPRIETFHSIHG